MGAKTASKKAIASSSGRGLQLRARKPLATGDLEAKNGCSGNSGRKLKLTCAKPINSVSCKSTAEDLPIDDVDYSAVQSVIRCWSDDWGAVGLVLDDLNNHLELLP